MLLPRNCCLIKMNISVDTITKGGVGAFSHSPALSYLRTIYMIQTVYWKKSDLYIHAAIHSPYFKKKYAISLPLLFNTKP